MTEYTGGTLLNPVVDWNAVMEFPFILMGGLVFFGIAAYVFLMIFLPEWVGITGKVAQENMRRAAGDTQLDDNSNGSSEITSSPEEKSDASVKE